MASSSGQALELDVYLPELQLAAEYQGQHHYLPVYSVEDFLTMKQRDKEKQEACKRVLTQ